MASNTACRETVTIEVSSLHGLYSGHTIGGELEEFASRQIVLLTAEEIELFTNITVRSKDLLFKGDVIKCIRHPQAGWRVHVHLTRTLLVV